MEPGSTLLSLPEVLQRKVLSYLARYPTEQEQLNNDKHPVHGLKWVAQSCKPLQQVSDGFVKKLVEPQELPVTHAAMAMQQRWPHAHHARVRSVHVAAELLAVLPQLSELHVRADEDVTLGALAPVSQLRSLELKTAGGRPDLTLAALPQLHTFKASDMRVTNLSVISTFLGLQELEMWDCLGADDLRPLSTLTRLESLTLSQCGLRDLRPLSGLTKLTSMNLSRNYTTLVSLATLSNLTGLRSLNMDLCRAVTSLTPLSTLTGLTTLDMVECVAVTSLKPLSTVTGLSTLDMSECYGVTSLDGLSTLTGLSSLDGLTTLTGLTTLNMNY